jgi:branched-chain amino acid transport system permease protein
MGSIVGAIVAGFGLGVIEGITKLVYPDGAAMVVFVVMLIVLAVRPQGLFGSLR